MNRPRTHMIVGGEEKEKYSFTQEGIAVDLQYSRLTSLQNPTSPALVTLEIEAGYLPQGYAKLVALESDGEVDIRRLTFDEDFVSVAIDELNGLKLSETLRLMNDPAKVARVQKLVDIVNNILK